MFTVESQGHKFRISIEDEIFTSYTIEGVKKGLEHYWAQPFHRYTIPGCPLCTEKPQVNPPSLS